MDFFPSLNWIFAGYTGSKNPIHQTQNFKLENDKNQVHIEVRVVLHTNIESLKNVCHTSSVPTFCLFSISLRSLMFMMSEKILNNESKV